MRKKFAKHVPAEKGKLCFFIMQHKMIILALVFEDEFVVHDEM